MYHVQLLFLILSSYRYIVVTYFVICGENMYSYRYILLCYSPTLFTYEEHVASEHARQTTFNAAVTSAALDLHVELFRLVHLFINVHKRVRYFAF